MKQKSIVALLVVLFIFSISACSSEAASALEVYNSALAKNEELTSLDLNMKLDMDMVIGEEKVTIASDSAIKMENPAGSNLKMDMKMDMSLSGIADGAATPEQITMQTYYSDGFYYMNMMGMKVKQAMDLETINAQAENMTGMEPLPEEILKDIKLEQSGDYQILSFTGNGEIMTEYIMSYMGQMKDFVNMSDSQSIAIKEVSGVFYVNKEGYIDRQEMNIAMNVTVEGESADMDMKLDIIYNQPGKQVTVQLPDDLDQYQEIPAQ
ncbi:MAG: DUF6612 family protein [Clostridiales bacterium]